MFLKNFILAVLNRLMAWVKSDYFFVTALMLVSFYKFADLAWNVHRKDDITVYDALIVGFVNQLASKNVTQAALFMTDFGGVHHLFALWLLSAEALFFYRRWREGLLVTASTLGGTCLMLVLKDLFQRARPVVGAPILREVGFSFPSGHSTVAMCFYGVLIYLAARHCKPLWLKLLACSVLSAFIVLIGMTRVYLGVHYPTDVLAGYLLGLFWLSLCCLLYIRSLKPKSNVKRNGNLQ